MNRQPISERLELLDQTTTYSLTEVCERSGVHTEFIVELVEYGIISPVEQTSDRQWAFDVQALARLRRAQRLQQDLNLNLPGVALSLELLDDLQRLRHQVGILDQQLKQLLGGDN